MAWATGGRPAARRRLPIARALTLAVVLGPTCAFGQGVINAADPVGDRNTINPAGGSLETTDGPPPPRGGSYVYPAGIAHVTSGDGVLRVTGFDPVLDAVAINGQLLSPTALPAGVTAWNHEGSTVIGYGDGEAVVLRGVTVAQWEVGVASQIHGGGGNDVLLGPAGSSALAGGVGADTIVAGAGDNRINYTSGDDLVLGDGMNAGADTLDLRRYQGGEVVFVASGPDILVRTPDGVIRLEAQLLHGVGHPRSNIETILFDDGELDEAGIRARALAQ